jgi:hypothetical protein
MKERGKKINRKFELRGILKQFQLGIEWENYSQYVKPEQSGI